MIFTRPTVTKEMDKEKMSKAVSANEIAFEKTISRAVTYAINGGYTDDEKRLTWTKKAKDVIYDY
jgi:23S rRNA A1618 N6-methylase RlmF